MRLLLKVPETTSVSPAQDLINGAHYDVIITYRDSANNAAAAHADPAGLPEASPIASSEGPSGVGPACGGEWKGRGRSECVVERPNRSAFRGWFFVSKLTSSRGSTHSPVRAPSLLHRVSGAMSAPPAVKLTEVLPKSGLVYSEKGALSEVLSKPKIMPLKSVTLERIEEMERQAAQAAELSRSVATAQRQEHQAQSSFPPPR